MSYHISRRAFFLPHAERVRISYISNTSFHLMARPVISDRIEKIALVRFPAPKSVRQWVAPKIAAHFKFAHLYIRVDDGIRPVYIHGFGFNPETGRMVHSDLKENSFLRMFALTPAEDLLDLSLSRVKPLPSHQLNQDFRQAAAVIFGRILDTAEAINKAEFKYESANLKLPDYWNTRSPINSNAGVGACLDLAGLIRDPEEMRIVIPGYMAPGFRRNLGPELTVGNSYTAMAKDGAGIAELSAAFRARWVWKPPAEEPVLPALAREAASAAVVSL